LIVTAQFMIGLVVLLELLAFLSLNTYLITIFAFAQMFIVVGISLFLIAIITGRHATVVGERGPDEASADTD
jgi:hypothetical protein